MISHVEVPGGRLETLDLPATRAGAPGILLLHEGLGSVSMWRDFPARLAAATGARVVAYSRHGFGRSAPRATPVTARFMHDEAQATLPALRAALGLGRALLVGHSTGASMALLHAAHDPAGVAAVVALAPFVFVEPANLAAIAAARAHYAESDWRHKLDRHHDDVDAVFRGWWGIWLDAAFRDWSIAADLAPIRCPVLAVVGERDEYSSPAQVAAVAAHAPAATVETQVLAECGHAPHRDAADWTVAAAKRLHEAVT